MRHNKFEPYLKSAFWGGLMALCMLIGHTVGISAKSLNVDKQLSYCHEQVLRSLQQLRRNDGTIDYTQTPRNIALGEDHWNLRNAKTPEEWTSGFWPGILWMEASPQPSQPLPPPSPKGEGAVIRKGEGAAAIIEAAEGYTKELEYLAYQSVFDHDLGFIVIGSFLKGYEVMHNDKCIMHNERIATHYRDVLLAAADTLATLYNPRVGTLLSWPRNVGMFGGHNTIMDNMINLELLFWAADELDKDSIAKGNSKEAFSPSGELEGGFQLRRMAVSHADTTMRYHFRSDYSINHVAVYDPLTGQHIRNCNHQGLNDSSLWSRGQAWAIYGYTMVFRYTKDRKYLDFVQKVADRMIAELPKDGIPYWDMRDPRIPNTYRDASAGAVIADALIELAGYVGGEKGRQYLAQAKKMLTTLSSKRYQCRKTSPAFLLHSVGNYPAGSEIDYSIVYADYYYLEALLRLKDME